jgi:biofilm PGA synthesis protein PgaD
MKFDSRHIQSRSTRSRLAQSGSAQSDLVQSGLTQSGLTQSRLSQSSLIDNSDTLSRSHRVFWGGITGVFWLLYLYLWLPLITLVMWLLGVNNALVEVYMPEGRVDAYLLVTLPLIALVCAAVLTVWAEYNLQRFKGMERRVGSEKIGIEMIAHTLGASSEVAAAMRGGKRMTLTMSDTATPVAVREHETGLVVDQPASPPLPTVPA